MRNMGVFVIVSVTVALVVGVLFFSFAPSAKVAMAGSDAAVEEGTAPEIAQSYAVREAALRAQIDRLQTAVGERLRTYAEQKTTLANAQTASDERATALAQQAQLLGQQLEEAAALRASSEAQLAQQLQQVQAQYAARSVEITVQIDEAQARLAEANQLLGR